MNTLKDIYDESRTFIQNGAHGEPNRVYDAANDYFKYNCSHPIKVRLFDSRQGKFVERHVPCGRCWHCRNTKKNEWVTRMFYHMYDYKYVYFVTLTYRSYDEHTNKVGRFCMDYLSDACFHLDSFNVTQHYCYSPVFLVKKHYQNYIKRLRKQTGVKGLTYFGCGEYGSKYARPHYHFIFFSNEPISTAAFTYAWGLDIALDSFGNVSTSTNNSVTSKHHVSFGRVQVDDLVENGTISDYCTIDNKVYSSHHAFAYVAKYVCKNKFNTKRLQIIYDELKKVTSDFNPIWSEFIQENRPFCAISRGTAIGSLWLARNIETISQGNCPKSPLQSKFFVVPTYFRRKTSEYLYSLRLNSAHNTACRGNLPLIALRLAEFIKRDVPLALRPYIHETDKTTFKLPFKTLNYVTDNYLDLLKSPDCFVDIHSRSRFLLCYDPISPDNHTTFDCWVQEYKYINRKWIHVNSFSVEKWCEKYLLQMPYDYIDFNNRLQQAEQNNFFIEQLECFYATFSDLGSFFVAGDYSNDKKLKQQDAYETTRFSECKL